MAYRTPAAIQNENFHIRIGKDVDQVKAALPRPGKPGRQDRKALKDVSNTRKPPVSGPSKTSALKEKSAICGWETASGLKENSALRDRETIKNAPEPTSLTDEEMKRCHEWAREGIEQAHFTGNDLQKLQKDTEEERVNKKVQKVISYLHEWLTASYDLGLPKKELSKDTTDVKMELETEVLPCITKSPTSGYEEIDNLPEPEVDHRCFLEWPTELELKED